MTNKKQLIAFNYFAEKAGEINARLNELMDEIEDHLEISEGGDEAYVKKLLYKLEDIEAEWLDIYDLQEDYNNCDELYDLL